MATIATTIISSTRVKPALLFMGKTSTDGNTRDGGRNPPFGPISGRAWPTDGFDPRRAAKPPGNRPLGVRKGGRRAPRWAIIDVPRAVVAQLVEQLIRNQ